MCECVWGGTRIGRQYMEPNMMSWHDGCGASSRTPHINTWLLVKLRADITRLSPHTHLLSHASTQRAEDPDTQSCFAYREFYRGSVRYCNHVLALVGGFGQDAGEHPQA